MKKLFVVGWLALGVLVSPLGSLSVVQVQAEEASDVIEKIDLAPTSTPGMVYLFGRDDCGFCKKEREFLTEAKIPYRYLNIRTDETAQALYDQVVDKHDLTKVTPITVIGDRVFLGFE